MKFFQKIILFLLPIVTRMRSFIQDYIIPVIQFVNGIKALLESEIDEKTFEWKKYFSDYMGIAQDVIEFLVKAFAKAAKALCPPDIITSTVYKQIIIQFANYVKTLEKRQRNFLYFKIASMMLMEWYSFRNKGEELKESECDFWLQFTYTYNKIKPLS